MSISNCGILVEGVVKGVGIGGECRPNIFFHFFPFILEPYVLVIVCVREKGRGRNCVCVCAFVHVRACLDV